MRKLAIMLAIMMIAMLGNTAIASAEASNEGNQPYVELRGRNEVQFVKAGDNLTVSNGTVFNFNAKAFGVDVKVKKIFFVLAIYDYEYERHFVRVIESPDLQSSRFKHPKEFYGHFHLALRSENSILNIVAVAELENGDQYNSGTITINFEE